MRRNETADPKDAGIFGTTVHRGHRIWWTVGAATDRKNHGLRWAVWGGVQIWIEGECGEIKNGMKGVPCGFGMAARCFFIEYFFLKKAPCAIM